LTHHSPAPYHGFNIDGAENDLHQVSKSATRDTLEIETMSENQNEIEINGRKFIAADSIPATSQLPDISEYINGYPPPGTPVLLRTEKYHYTGRIVGTTDTTIVLTEPAWIADTGLFSKAVLSGEFAEVEPWPEKDQVVVPLSLRPECTVLTTPLPREQK
jgi:hypothetical protein